MSKVPASECLCRMLFGLIRDIMYYCIIALLYYYYCIIVLLYYYSIYWRTSHGLGDEKSLFPALQSLYLARNSLFSSL
jgi:hypothetical protein